MCNYLATKMVTSLLKRLVLLLNLLVLHFNSGCTSTTVLIVVEEGQWSQCPRNHTIPCHSLEYYEQHTSEFFQNNTKMKFLPGTHRLESSLPIMLMSVSNFTMIGSDNFTTGPEGLLESTSKIQCTGTNESGFFFNYATNILVENLTLVSCEQVLEGARTVRVSLALYNVFNATILRTTFRNSTGFGLHADNVFGNLTVKESAFLHNAGNSKYYGGNARFWYSHCPENATASVRVEASSFLHGNATYKHHFYTMAPGITVIINCSSINVDIENSTLVANYGDNGGNIAINLTYFGNNAVRISNSVLHGGRAHRGGGLRIWSIMTPTVRQCGQNISTSRVIHVANTSFSNNYAIAGGGALYISHYELGHIQCDRKLIHFENCSFTENTVPATGNGAVMEVIKHKIPGILTQVTPQFEVRFTRCSFSNNSLLVDRKDLFVGAIVNIFSVGMMTFNNCNFTGNNNTALSITDSNLIFEGEIVFKRNSAANGGALNFRDMSVMYIRPQTHVQFISNHARKAGGAIYIGKRSCETAAPCFFQPDVPDFTHVSDLSGMMSLEFINNTAGIAGDALYGGAIDQCYTFNHFSWYGRNSYYESGAIFNHIFNDEKQAGESRISSDPYGVCLCNSSGQYNCSVKSTLLETSIFPGQVFSINVVAVGQRKGIVPATVEAHILENKGSAKFNRHPLQKVGKKCQAVSYSISSGASNETVELQTQQSDTSFYYNFQPPKVIVSFLPCPWGFQPCGSPPHCQCDSLLREHDIECDLDSQCIERPRLPWIGHNYRKGEPVAKSTIRDGTQSTEEKPSLTHSTHELPILYHPYCPFDYCKARIVNITFNTTEDQCDHFRTGILCGACREGFSLMLGSTNCHHCSNNWLALSILLALAGFLLVFLLTGLNLTVSQGTLNALVFYANIVQVNSDTLFPRLPESKHLTTLQKIPRVFIAWLNLDLGIETCFYDGLDAYARTWLQFAFPIYIWVIAGVIIYLSRKSSLVSRMFGRHAVNVLATLFLLSYTKLQRTVVTALSFTHIHSSDGEHKTVWLSDANIEYLQGKHIPLFITAFLFGVLTLPYTLVLTFIQWLQRVPSRRLCVWVRKLKPFFDAYTGPYKVRMCYWTGLLLTVRILLLTTFATNVLREPEWNLAVIAVACITIITLAFVMGGVYRKRPLDVLEASFFLNLAVLCVATNQIINNDGRERTQTALTVTSVTITFLTFAGISIYHVYKQINSSHALRNSKRWIRRKWSTHRCRRRRYQPLLGVVDGSISYGSTSTQDDEESKEGGKGGKERQPKAPTVQELPFPGARVAAMARYDQYREPVLEYEDIH